MCLKPITFAALCALSFQAAATNNICAIAIVESGDNMRARGAKGERTAWQILPSTWKAYVKPGEKLNILSRADAYVIASRIYAHNYVRFVHATGNRPTHTDVYAMWNLGYNGYRRRRFDIERCPAITRRAAAKYLTLCVNIHSEN